MASYVVRGHQLSHASPHETNYNCTFSCIETVVFISTFCDCISDIYYSCTSYETIDTVNQNNHSYAVVKHALFLDEHVIL